MTRRSAWLLAAMGLILILAASAPAFPQEAPAPAAEGASVRAAHG